ncbi:hypothetical protein IPG41_06605 [Candidatus Peregrinibacteria bacterium]|nr:MAG: hypothetical protein IPG41_06605 [Candidatus Peregrinibacteria bacterium]
MTLRSRSAESIIETLIAITVIVLSSAAALSMLRTALRGNYVIGEKLVALELALEGLDAVKNIRDSNYLLFASDADTCWNKLGLTLSSDCATATAITDGEEYYLIQNFSNAPLYRWNMQLAVTDTDGFMDLFEYTDSTGTTVPLYSDRHNSSVSGFSSVDANAFKRLISIDYDPLDSAGNDLCPEDTCFEATVTVEWSLAEITQNVSLTRLISHVY